MTVGARPERGVIAAVVDDGVGSVRNAVRRAAERKGAKGEGRVRVGAAGRAGWGWGGRRCRCPVGYSGDRLRTGRALADRSGVIKKPTALFQGLIRTAVTVSRDDRTIGAVAQALTHSGPDETVAVRQ